MRNEWRECLKLNLDWKVQILKSHLRQRKLPCEFCTGKPAQTGDIVRSQTILALVRRQQTGLKHASDRLGLTRFHPDGRKSIVGRPALIGAIENFPIPQLTTAAQCNAAGSDSAQWESDHLQLCTAEDPWELNFGVSFTRLILFTG